MMLYKYTRIDNYLKANLIGHQLWFSRPSDFNDINDSNLRLDDRYTDEEIRLEANFVEEQIYRDAIIGKDLSDNVLQRVAEARSVYQSVLADRGPDGRPDFGHRLHRSVEAVLEYRRQNIGILCLTQENRNELMWAHYADKYQGVCLGIETDFDRECFVQLNPVTYVDRLPKVKLLSHMGQNLVALYTTKSSSWSYEKEVRAFQHVFGNHRMDPRCLVKVLFGLRVRPADMKEICSLVRDKYGRQVELLQMSKGKEGDLEFRALAA
jgi:hypothetical protein